MRCFIPSVLCCCLLLAHPTNIGVAAEPSAPSSGKAQEAEAPEGTDDALPEDPFAEPAEDQESAEQDEQGAGATAWEQLKSEREPEPSSVSKDEPPETFSPFIVWRMIRRLWSDD